MAVAGATLISPECMCYYACDAQVCLVKGAVARVKTGCGDFPSSWGPTQEGNPGHS